MKSKEILNLPLKFWIVALIAFINSVGFTLLIPILYPYAKAFRLSDFEASLLITAYAAFQFIATPNLGKLSDCLGRKLLLCTCLLHPDHHLWGDQLFSHAIAQLYSFLKE